MTSLWIVPLSHDNGGDLTPVIRLVSQRFTPIAEEKRFVLACAWRKALNTPDAGVLKALIDKAREVKVGAQMRTAAFEVAAVGLIAR
jgi:hypothetical protein